MIDLLPHDIQLERGRQNVSILKALAPSMGMLGPSKLVMRAMRLERCLWDVRYIPWRWWYDGLYVPLVRHGTTYLDSHWKRYAYLRVMQAVAHKAGEHAWSLGPDVRVVGYDALDPLTPKRNAELSKVVRRIFYLSTEPGDGFTIEPDETCINSMGGAIRARPPSDEMAKHAAQQCERFLIDLDARERGLVRSLNRSQWVTSQERDEEYKLSDAAGEWLRRAHGGS
jgi:hypothetical protein